MFPAIKLQTSNPPSLPFNGSHSNTNTKTHFSNLHQPQLRFSSLSSSSQPSRLSFSVGSSPSLHLSQWNLTHPHFLMLNVFACMVPISDLSLISRAAVSATWLFFSAIPTLLAFKRAAESLEKLLDVTREELPNTMAAVRLSGMEISDLTMELSDLGQEITQGVRNSTRAVRLAEERLRQLTTMPQTASVQEVANLKAKTVEPVVARTARGLREGIVKGRSILQIFFTLTQFSRVALNYFSARGRKL
ncbi:hypothetical protein HHK36_030612 [Tetracentron sinense]|uniref:Uncharacterized protein n=1 Tax=Tetracentron sinense TaxID=13715 RepID=A0A834Y9N5_TETSI|nr:hypothetical protein HHK36_030612 [Tetracentron sinense]